MKATGIVRKLDELGRIVIPSELRNTLGYEEGQALEVYVDGDSVVLEKYSRGCQICGEMEVDINNVNGKEFRLCKSCIEDILNQELEPPF